MKRIYLISGTSCVKNNPVNIHESKSLLGLFLSELLSNLYGVNVVQEFCSAECFYNELIKVDENDIVVSVQSTDCDLEWFEGSLINRQTKIILIGPMVSKLEFFDQFPNTVAMPMPRYKRERKMITDTIGKPRQFRPTYKGVCLTSSAVM